LSKLVKANWEKWGRIPLAELWEAVALSFDVEPSSLAKRLGLEWFMADDSNSPFEECEFKDFQELIDIAVSNVKSGELRVTSRDFTNTSRSTVRLSVFADWAESEPQMQPQTAQSLRWDLPDQFPRESNPAIIETSSNKSDAAGTPPDLRSKVSKDEVFDEAVRIAKSAEFQRGEGEGRTASERLLNRLRTHFPNMNPGTRTKYAQGALTKAKGNVVRLPTSGKPR
jgi:hypothetical protein